MRFKKFAIYFVGLFILLSLSCSLFAPAAPPQAPEREIDLTRFPEKDPHTAEAEFTPLPTQTAAPSTSEPERSLGTLFYNDGDSVYSMDMDRLESTAVISSEQINSPRISPDGRYLAYLELYEDPDLWGIGQLRVLDLSAEEFLPLNLPHQDLNSFSWGPDSGRIAYTRMNPQYCQGGEDLAITSLYSYSLGSEESRLLLESGDDYIFWLSDWSPNGRYVAYRLGLSCSEGWQLNAYDTQKGAAVPIPYTEGHWHPSGSKMAVIQYSPFGTEAVPLVEYVVETGSEKVLASQEDRMAHNGLWSPDGRWIALNLSVMDPFEPVPYLLDYESGALEEIPLSQAQIEVWGPSSENLILSVGDYYIRDYYLYELQSGEYQKILSGIEGREIQWIGD